MPHPPAALAYEIPLAPGELRVHEADGTITLVWLPSATRNRGDLMAMGFWTVVLAGLLAFFAYNFRSAVRGGVDLCSILFLVFATVAMLISFVSRARGGRRAVRTMTADRTHVTFNEDLYGTVTIADVSHFSAEPTGVDHHVLIIHPRLSAHHVRWWHFPRSSPPPRSPVKLLTHPDADLLRATATRLNALLKASSVSDPTPTKMSPPPSPAPPWR